MENPFDKLGEVAKGGGNVISEFLFGFARMLEYATGDAKSAAIFAAFLLFTLSLIRGGASSKNFLLYAGSLVAVGGGGLLLIVGVGVAGALPHLLSLWQPNEERDFLYQGLTSHKFSEEWKLHVLLQAVPGLLAPYKWYAFILLNVLAVGLIMFAIAAVQERFRAAREE